MPPERADFLVFIALLLPSLLWHFDKWVQPRPSSLRISLYPALLETSHRTCLSSIAGTLSQKMSTDPTTKMEEREKISISSSNPNSNPNSSAFFSPSRPQRIFLVAQSTLRALAVASTLVALSVMVTSEESVVVFGIRLEAHYNYSSAFR